MISRRIILSPIPHWLTPSGQVAEPQSGSGMLLGSGTTRLLQPHPKSVVKACGIPVTIKGHLKQ